MYWLTILTSFLPLAPSSVSNTDHGLITPSISRIALQPTSTSASSPLSPPGASSPTFRPLLRLLSPPLLRSTRYTQTIGRQLVPLSKSFPARPGHAALSLALRRRLPRALSQLPASLSLPSSWATRLPPSGRAGVVRRHTIAASTTSSRSLKTRPGPCSRPSPVRPMDSRVPA